MHVIRSSRLPKRMVQLAGLLVKRLVGLLSLRGRQLLLLLRWNYHILLFTSLYHSISSLFSPFRSVNLSFFHIYSLAVKKTEMQKISFIDSAKKIEFALSRQKSTLEHRTAGWANIKPLKGACPLLKGKVLLKREHIHFPWTLVHEILMKCIVCKLNTNA